MNMQHLSIAVITDERSLIAKLIKREPAALEVLYDRYSPILYTVGYEILNSAEEAEEVVLDIFTQVWRNPGSYNPQRGAVDTWLFMLLLSKNLR
jgi:DNA-directed RNA polymerase specialized sigma24 family protein